MNKSEGTSTIYVQYFFVFLFYCSHLLYIENGEPKLVAQNVKVGVRVVFSVKCVVWCSSSNCYPYLLFYLENNCELD